MNVAGYVRVSTEQQREEGSHERQRARLKEWAEHNDHDLELFEDIAISGQAEDREAYNEMIERAEEFDAIVVRELSRFGRNLQRIINDIADLQERGVEFVELKGDWDTTTASGQLMFNIRASLNQYWSDLASERAQEMVERRRAEGKPIGRPKKLDREQRQQVAEWYDENGLGPSQIQALAEQMWGVEVSRDTIYRYAEEFAE